MPTLDNVNFDSLYCMFKGEPGTRKSTQALSFPKPQYWFSWDRKMSSLYLPMKKWGVNPKDISYDNYDDWTRAQQKLEKFRGDCPYKTLIFDSITSMCDATLRQTITMKYGKARQSGNVAGKFVAGIPVNELEDYNAEASALMELLSLTHTIRDMNKVNIILIAHVIQAEYRDTTKKITHVSRQIVTASKKAASRIPAYVGEIYHFNIKTGLEEGAGGDYSLLTEHTGDDFAKTELGLDKEIIFKEAPLYDTYLKPAIAKLTKPPTTL